MTSKRGCLWFLLALGFVLTGIGAIGVHALSTGPGRDIHVVRLHGPAPSFELSHLRDARSHLRLTDFRGRGLVLNFWASWCAPCRREMKGFDAESRHESGRVIFVGVDANDDRSAALAFARRLGISYPLAFDPLDAVAQRYGVVGLPSTVFIDANGMLLERRLGAMTQDELARTIAVLLAR